MLAYKDSTINTAVPGAIDNNAKYDGFIYLNIGGLGGINLSPLTNLNPSAQADFTLTAYVQSTPSINGSGTVSVKKLKIEKRINGLVVAIAHPSGANAGRVNCYMGKKQPIDSSYQWCADRSEEAITIVKQLLSKW